MFKKKYIYYAIGALLVAAIWGYFSDLKNGNVDLFIGRLFFMPIFVVALEILVFERRN